MNDLLSSADFSLNTLQAFSERCNRRLVCGVTLCQHGHSVANVAYIFMGRGELLDHLFHESRELGDAFFCLGRCLLTALTVSWVASPCTESFTAAMISVLSALRSAFVAGSFDWL